MRNVVSGTSPVRTTPAEKPLSAAVSTSYAVAPPSGDHVSVTELGKLPPLSGKRRRGGIPWLANRRAVDQIFAWILWVGLTHQKYIALTERIATFLDVSYTSESSRMNPPANVDSAQICSQ